MNWGFGLYVVNAAVVELLPIYLHGLKCSLIVGALHVIYAELDIPGYEDVEHDSSSNSDSCQLSHLHI